MSLLESSLLPTAGRAITDQVLDQLKACAPRDVQDLLPHLQSRGEEYAADARKKLRDRGDAEAKAMREILETQKKHIGDTVAKYDKPDNQLKLGFAEDEVHQLNDNRKYWAKRLAAIEIELAGEPDRIRDLYDVKATRIEPVGLVYLWPVTG